MRTWQNEVTEHHYHYYGPQKRYGFWKFMGDLFMISITGGLWLIWIIVRYLRNH